MNWPRRPRNSAWVTEVAYTVVYDACVLYPAPLRDLLVELARTGLFRAKWTHEIHEEWMRNVLANRPDIRPEALARTRDLMDRAVADCLISGYEHLVSAVELPDPGDRHVVAAAIHARGDAIVTFNLRDFPSQALGRYDLEAIHPDDFIGCQLDLDEAAVLVAARRCRTRLRSPPMDAQEYLMTLARQSLPKTVGALRRFAEVI